jgi:hypothetical protein
MSRSPPPCTFLAIVIALVALVIAAEVPREEHALVWLTDTDAEDHVGSISSHGAHRR